MSGKFYYTKGTKATGVALGLLGTPIAGAAIGSMFGGGDKERALRGAQIGGGIGVVVGLLLAIDALRGPSKPTR